MPRESFHGSEPEARDFLRAMQRLGWASDGWSIERATGRRHANNGASSLRWWLDQLGFVCAGGADPVACDYVRETDKGRRVYVYTVHDDVRRLMRFGLLANPDSAVRILAAERKRARGQAALF